MTRVFKVDPLNPDQDVIRQVASILRSGGLVAFPTETVYGLGAAVFNEQAVRRVYNVKQRPFDNPLIIHISSLEMLYLVAEDISEREVKLIEKFWPGPLTLILPRNPRVPRVVSGGLDTVAVRMPAHPVALALIRELGEPIAAPSANLAGRPSPTSAEHVIQDLYGKIDAIVDGGVTLYGIESTIINARTNPPILLRPGAYPVEEIERVLGEKVAVPDYARGLGEATLALAPGMRYRHYAPETPLILVDPVSGRIDTLVSKVLSTIMELRDMYSKICVVSSKETANAYRSLEGVSVIEIGSRWNIFEVTRNLFKTLRILDTLKCDIGLVEGFEERGLGLAVMNRLRKASYKRILA
ncbi:MAG: threonylcarbamoyl-AMP synthase [Desulfurococcaceae archaeon]|nr:threonylcarbamoyl-AMP synthase [Desulfurococcaceae archaeon]